MFMEGWHTSTTKSNQAYHSERDGRFFLEKSLK